MTRAFFAVVLVAVFAAGWSGPAAAQEKPSEFELEVNGRVHSLTEGQPLTLEAPEGRRLTLVLRRKKILGFSGHGVRFNYHHRMTLTTEKGDQVATVTVECTESPLAVIQVYPAGTSPGEVGAALLESLKDSFLKRQAVFEAGGVGEVSRVIGGQERAGRKLKLILAGQKLETEIYAWAKGQGVVALLLQHDLEDAALAGEYFRIILDSLD